PPAPRSSSRRRSAAAAGRTPAGCRSASSPISCSRSAPRWPRSAPTRSSPTPWPPAGSSTTSTPASSSPSPEVCCSTHRGVRAGPGTGGAGWSPGALRLLLLPPLEETLAGDVLTERSVLHAQAEQEPVRLADDGTGRDAEDLHDLLAVEVRPDLGQLLLPGELGDPLLEVVVGRGQAHRLATVP